MTLLSISSCPTDLLYFTELKDFSNSSKVKTLYSIFFCTENRKSWNVLDVFCILLARFSPTFVKYWLNFSAMRLFFFYRLSIKMYWFRKSFRVNFTFSRDFFHYLPCACHVVLTILKYRLIVCLLSSPTQFFKKMFTVLVNLFIFNRFVF